MKREGYTYVKTYDWDNMVKAEASATKRKTKRHDVRKHIANRLKYMCEIQQGLIDKSITTSDYAHMTKVSGQGKIRDISKLKFHPNHIYHQCLVLAGEERIERNLIYDTYASRIGKGQIAGALRVKQWLKEDPEGTVWFGQGDVKKYYANIRHEILQESLEHIFKDKTYVEKMMEPVRKFGTKGLPLGIRPSQMMANLVLSRFDHWAKEEAGMKYYIRYMDDFVVLCSTKGKVRKFMRDAGKKLEELRLEMHVPKVHKISTGMSFLGFVFKPGGDMFWRNTNKKAWLKRRSKVTNPKRIKEIDSAAWGMLKHGNRHCKKLFKKMSGVDLKSFGIYPESTLKDKEGKKFFDEQRISASMILNKEIEVLDWEKDIKTSQGKGRWVLLIKAFGEKYKLIINSIRIKNFIERLEEKGITSFSTMLVDRTGNKHYDFDFDRTMILSINGNKIKDDIIKR